LTLLILDIHFFFRQIKI